MTFPPVLDINWAAFSPPLILLIVACITILFALFFEDSRWSAFLSLLGLAAAAVFNVALFQSGRPSGSQESSRGFRAP